MSAAAVARVEPLASPPDAVVRLPGSKSITNRALLCAALASGPSVLRGALFADDTRAMMHAVAALGASVDARESEATVRIVGGRLASAPARIHAGQSGTTSRFVLAAAALGSAECVVDGDAQLHRRPFGPLADALVQLGASVRRLEVPGHLPLAVRGPLAGGEVAIPGHISSQFLSGLMLAGPRMEHGLTVELTSPLVSAPYVEMTRSVMAAFGGVSEGLRVEPGEYSAADFAVEPDASAHQARQELARYVPGYRNLSPCQRGLLLLRCRGDQRRSRARRWPRARLDPG
jgi:3-phosphoshikimate 1-carboxyvinyltransferase